MQLHSSWAYATNTNLLASGYSEPANYNGGTGIYAGRKGILKTIMPFNEDSELIDIKTHISNRLLISKVPKQIHGYMPTLEDTTRAQNPTKTSERVFFPDYLSPYTKYTINESEINTTICDRGLCCKFEIKSQIYPSISDAIQFRIVVFNGIRPFFGGKTGGIQVCAIIACNNSTLESCSVPTDTTKPSSTFRHISIEGNFNRTNAVHMPSTLLNSILPLNVNMYEIKTKNISNNETHVCIQTKKPVKNIKTFGIYGRQYGIDGYPFTM